MKVTVSYTKNNFLMNHFSLELSKNISDSMKDFEKRKGYVDGANNHHLLNEAEKYVSRVFRVQSSLINTCEQLDHIKIYLNRYPFKKYYFDKGISQLEYIQYHTEALFHKIHTILEIMKLMVNEVYQLNIPSKDCSWIKLISKLPKTIQPMKCLDNYFKAFSDVIDRRHINTHRGHYQDQEKDDIDLKFGYGLYKFERDGFSLDDDFKANIPMPIINHLLREHKKKRVKLVETCIKENEKHLTTFLGSLLTEYKSQIQKKSI